MNEPALNRLRTVLESVRSGQNAELKEIVDARDTVLERYRPIFSPEQVADLTADEFKSFLLFQNNRHWLGIHRQGNQIVEDMPRLREAMLVLLDESRPIEERLRRLRPKKEASLVKGLARSVITPILLVSRPDKYGVLNQVAESGMKELDLWPHLDRGVDFAAKYVSVNEILRYLTEELAIDLWTLDALWWGIGSEDEETGSTRVVLEPEAAVDDPMVFGLEKFLHEFLFDNWERTELGSEWDLFEEDGELVGFKYHTGEVGEIDLLARHRSEPKWLVIELKRGRTSDAAVGQALRYRGWVRKRLAAPDEKIEILIIAHKPDPKVMFALEGIDGAGFQTYSVSFALETPSKPWDDD